MLNNKKVFISHSTNDKNYAGEIITLLRSIGISQNQIFCSSYEGYNVPLGKNFINYIKQQLDNNPITLLLISPNFYNSPMSMCELGAIWGMDIEHINIIMPPMTYKDLHIAFSNEQVMYINDSDKLDSLYSLLIEEFQLSHLHPTIWSKTKELFLTNTNDLLKKK